MQLLFEDLEWKNSYSDVFRKLVWVSVSKSYTEKSNYYLTVLRLISGEVYIMQ